MTSRPHQAPLFTTCLRLAATGLLGSPLWLGANLAQAQTPSAPQTAANAAEASDSMLTRQERSPWLLVPLVSSSPKLGSSLGLMAAYIKQFDAESSPSLMGFQAKRSDSHSQVLMAFGKLSFNSDRDRVIVGATTGKVYNNYQDYLGSGIQVNSVEDIEAYFARYLHSFAKSWYVGGQIVKANYEIDGEDPLSQDVLDQVGVTGAVSAGVGLTLLYDTRDNDNNPTSGLKASFFNLAFRNMLGGENKYDKYKGDVRWYQSTDTNNVVAVHGEANWTQDAPAANQSSISMRGYTRGQYLGKNMLTLEAEDRYMFRPQWGAKVFAGLSCLYGGGLSCSGDQLYPMAGLGVFYILKPKENMLISAEFAKGNGNNQGFYLRFGHPF